MQEGTGNHDRSQPPHRVPPSHGKPPGNNQPTFSAEESSFPAGNASPIFAPNSNPDRTESPFPAYPGNSPSPRDQTSPVPVYSSNASRVLALKYPPDVTEYPTIICYIICNFSSDFPDVNPDDYYDLWVDPRKLGLTTTRDFFTWLLKEPPDFYSSSILVDGSWSGPLL